MPRNKYISHGTRSEKDLYEDLIAEAIKVYGHDVYYLPRTIVKLDEILNEDVTSRFDSSHVCEMYIESVDGFEGDGKLITKFGLEIRDQLTFVVSVRRWNELVGRFGHGVGSNPQVRPQEGDLIYTPLTKGLFEIKFVEDKKPFFQLGDTPTYKLICELFESANQDLNTGVPTIDNIQGYTSAGFAFLVTFSDDNTEFDINTRVNLTLPNMITGSAELLKQERTATVNERKVFVGPLEFDDGVFHVVPVGTEIESPQLGVVGTINHVFTLANSTDDDTQVNDDNSQNSSFENTGNQFIDFTESNPFGEPDL